MYAIYLGAYFQKVSSDELSAWLALVCFVSTHKKCETERSVKVGKKEKHREYSSVVNLSQRTFPMQGQVVSDQTCIYWETDSYAVPYNPTRETCRTSVFRVHVLHICS